MGQQIHTLDAPETSREPLQDNWLIRLHCTQCGSVTGGYLRSMFANFCRMPGHFVCGCLQEILHISAILGLCLRGVETQPFDLGLQVRDDFA